MVILEESEVNYALIQTKGFSFWINSEIILLVFEEENAHFMNVKMADKQWLLRYFFCSLTLVILIGGGVETTIWCSITPMRGLK